MPSPRSHPANPAAPPDPTDRPRLRLGVRFEPRSEGSSATGHPSWLEELARVEPLGFDVVWIAERPTRSDALVPSALLLCAAVAAQTERLHVATGLLPLPLHHPLRVAEDAATLDLVSGGRFELGIGLGSDPAGLDSWGVAREDRSQRFAEAVDLVQQAFSGKPVSFQGRHFQLDATAVTPAPLTPGGPPLWLGAVHPEGQALAARVGAGLMLPFEADPSPYLEAAASASPSPRLAVLLDAESDPVVAATELVSRSTASTRLALDLVLPVPVAGVSGLEGVAEAVRAATS